MAFKDELKLHFDARIAVVNVVTSEEARVLQELTELANASGWPEGEGLYTWDVADQFQCLKPAKESFDTKREATPDTILRTIEDFAGGATFVLKDFHQVWEARRGVLRGIRNLAASWRGSRLWRLILGCPGSRAKRPPVSLRLLQS